MNSSKQILISISLAGLAALSVAQSNPTKIFKAYYAKTDAFTLKKDVAGLSKLMIDSATNDFVYISRPTKAGKSSTRNREQTIQDMTRVMPMVEKFSKVETTIVSSLPGKNSIVLTISNTVEMSTSTGPDGKPHKLVNHATSKDTWVKQGSTWKIKSAQNLKDDMKVDGKSIPGA